MAFDLPPSLEWLDTMPNPNTFWKKPQKAKNLFNEPGNLSGWQLFWKTGIGLVIGGVIAALLFIVMAFIGGMLTSAIGQQTGTWGTSNPMLSIILLFIGFLSTFIGNIAVAGIYNLFFSKKYYDGAKTFGLLLLTNGLLFFILAPIYIVFSSQIQSLFIILGFHIIFSVFVSACQMEFSANPNYSASALMGNIIGFAWSFLVYSIFYKWSIAGGVESQTYLMMLLPSILWYTLIPFGAGIREKIYYRFYEMGNNGFYIASPSEIADAQTAQERASQDENDINIEW